MTSVDRVAEGIVKGWREIAAEPGGEKKVERVVRAIESSVAQPAEYIAAVKLYRQEHRPSHEAGSR